jgi:oxygen-independent coproporphyrinogen-3 oxidase
MGITRLSLGVQSFSDDILKKCLRNHTSQLAITKIKLIQDNANLNLNIDLLSGLPGETNGSWHESVSTALQLQPDNITIYKMQAYSNTSFFKEGVREKQIELPTEEQELEFMEHAIHELLKKNYNPLTYFTFCKDLNHSHVYVDALYSGEDIFAFGPSGFGFVNNFCYQNTNNYNSYYEMINKSEIPINRGFKLSNCDLIVRDIIFNMKLCKIDVDKFREKNGFDLLLLSDKLQYLKTEGYIEIKSNTILLTSKGILYGDYVGIVIANEVRKIFNSNLSLSIS